MTAVSSHAKLSVVPQPPQPKIAIVHEYLTRMGGAERVAAILAEMYPDVPVYTLLYDAEKIGAAIDPARIRTSFLQRLPAFIRNNQKYLFPFIPQAIEAWDFSEYDIVISSNGAYAHGIITGSQTRHICYCHSPTRFLWDWTHEYQKENGLTTGWKKFFAPPMLKRLREWDRLSAYRVDRWIANSRTVADRIAKYYRAPSEVVYPPVELERAKYSVHHENYFLIVSQLTPYKKIDRAISVFNKLRRRLVVVGDGPQREYLQALAGPTVELLGWQSGEALRELLANCRGFILPGEEDFGIAPVEAMAAGKPVLALNRGGARETVVDVRRKTAAPTGVLFDEPSTQGLEDGLAIFFANEEKFVPARIRAHAKGFAREVFEAKMRAIVDVEWELLQTARNASDDTRHPPATKKGARRARGATR